VSRHIDKRHLPLMHGTDRHLALALGLSAAAVTALCSAFAGVDASYVIWRAAVSLVSVWGFQWSVRVVWQITADPIPTSTPPR
jgi:hypothetical protein